MGGPPGEASEHRGLVNFGVLAARVSVAALVLGAVAFVGVVFDGLRQGLTFGLMLRWLALFLAALLLASAALAATSALGGADRAQRRGERLSSGDVSLRPPRRRRRGGEDA